MLLFNLTFEYISNPYLNLDKEKTKEYPQMVKNIFDALGKVESKNGNLKLAQQFKESSESISAIISKNLDLKENNSQLYIILKILILVLALLTVVLIGGYIKLNNLFKSDKIRFEELQNKRDIYKKSEKERNLLSKKKLEEYRDTLYSLDSKIIKEEKSLKKIIIFLFFIKIAIPLIFVFISFSYIYLFY